MAAEVASLEPQEDRLEKKEAPEKNKEKIEAQPEKVETQPEKTQKSNEGDPPSAPENAEAQATKETAPSAPEPNNVENSSSDLPTNHQDGKQLSVMEAHGYLLGNVLGTGSYATVKLAFSSRHKCKVAVKIVSKRKSPTSYVLKFLPREIDAVRILRHPNIICFLQSIETTNRVYLIMEVADGGDVLKSVRHSKHIDEPTAGRWFGQTLGAIEYCHAKGVVHRDLKCENLLLDVQHNVKVTDFGFAGVYNVQEPIEPSSTFCGSYPYAPPEILRGIPYEPMTADFWSIGVILFTMVFGRLPFDDHNHRVLVKQVLAGPQFPTRHSYQLKVSTECRELILKILKPLPHRANTKDIQQDPWFSKHCKQHMVIKNPTKTNVMEVLKEEGSQESTDAFAEF